MRSSTIFFNNPEGGEEIYKKISVDFLTFMKMHILITKSLNLKRNGQINMQAKSNIQHNSIFLGRSASGPIEPPLFHF
jgi:hypothetical protein